ncbi:MAG: S41 family peptidase, partial [bacterium]
MLEVNGTDVRGASLTSVIGLIRGSIGKKIELLVSRDGKKILASLSAERVSIRTVEASQISSQVAYLEIASFATGTAQDVKNSLAKLKYADGVIIDLRNNPGGVIEEAVGVAELFIGSGVIVSYQVNGFE